MLNMAKFCKINDEIRFNIDNIVTNGLMRKYLPCAAVNPRRS